MKTDDKRGQVTVFVLLGIILILAITGSIFLLDGDPAEEEPSDQGNFNEDITPITTQIRSCTDTLVNERVRDLAIQGGLTDDEADALQTSATRQSHRLEGIDYYGDGEIIVPYWSYSTDSPDCGECTTETRIPSLTGEESFQEKTETYVEDNLRSCLQDFEDFEDQFQIETGGGPQAAVQFNREDTTTRLDWDVTVTDPETDSQYDIDQIRVNSDLPFRPLYETAVASLRQMGTEQLPTDFITKILAFLSLDNTIPPVEGGTKLSLSSDVWVLENVRSELRSTLANYASLITISGINDPIPTYNSEMLARFASDFTIILPDESTSQYDVDTTYRPTWPLFLRVDGSNSPIVTADTQSFGMKFFNFAFSNQDFSYDISYPLSFSFTDRNAPGDPITLRYGVEGNIRNTRSYDELAYGSDSAEDSTVDFTGLGANNVTVTIDGPTSDGGALTYTCAGETITKEDTTPGTEPINTQLPTCSDGQLTYTGSLISSQTKNVTVTPDTENSFSLRTDDLQNYTVSVSRRPVFDKNNHPVPEAVPSPYPELPYNATQYPNIDEFVSSEYVPADTETNPLDRENITAVFTQRDGSYATSQEFTNETTTRQVELFPGEYNVQVFAEYNLEEPIQTLEEEICGGFGPFEDCQTVPSQTIPNIQRNLVTQCVAKQTSEEEYQTFTENLADSDQDALTVAQDNGFDVQTCVDNELEEQNPTITTGSFTGQNTTSLNLSRDNEDITVKYFGYHPSQIVYTRDIRIMSSTLELAEQTKSIDALQPEVN